MVRDRENIKKLSRLGWRVLVIWECETMKVDQLAKLAARIRRAQLK